MYSNLRDSYILACAPSNSAADLIAKRLISGGTPIAKTTIFRMNAASRAWNTVDQELKVQMFFGCMIRDFKFKIRLKFV